MIEESNSGIPPLTCANVGTPPKDAHVLDLLRNQGRLPDLHYVDRPGLRSQRPQPSERKLPNTLLAHLLRAHRRRPADLGRTLICGTSPVLSRNLASNGKTSAI